MPSTVEEEQAATLVESFLTAFVSGDGDAMAGLLTEDSVLHQPRWPLDTNGREAIIDATLGNAVTFTDVDITVNEVVRAEDRIAAYTTATGRNVGPFRAEDREIAPTGETFTVPQFGMYHLEDDRIAEAWVLADALGILEQLDNLPTGPRKLLGIGFRQLRWRLSGRNSLQ